MTRWIRPTLLAAILGTIGPAGLVLVGVGCGDGQGAPTAPADSNARPYSLKTCVVSGEELGKMGEPMPGK